MLMVLLVGKSSSAMHMSFILYHHDCQDSLFSIEKWGMVVEIKKSLIYYI
jgi:hypothetical protein